MGNILSARGKNDAVLTSLRKLHSQSIYTLIDAIVFDSADEAYTSGSIAVANFRRFTLLIDLAVSGAPTDIVLRVQVSDDDTTFRNLMNGPFGDLRYEDSAGNKNEAVQGEILTPFMKLYVLSSGCTAGAYFTLTSKIIAGK